MNTQTQPIHRRPESAAQVGTDEMLIGLPPSPRPRFLEPFRHSAFSLGLVLLILSGGAFLAYDALSDPRQESSNNVMLIMLHYGLAVVYSVFLFLNNFLKSRHVGGRPARWLSMLLWLISAYALNREMAVFQQSTEWLCWALMAIGVAMVGYAWKESFPVRGQQLLYAVLAVGFWLFAYMAVYIAELYPVSIPMLIGLGLSAHTFVPLVFAVVLGKRLWQDARHEEHLRLGIGLGLVVPVVVVVGFLAGWISDVNRIERVRQDATVRKTSDLPDWVLIAQELRPAGVAFDWITNRLLLSGRVYDKGRFFDGNGWGLDGLTALDDVRQHDPLVVIASRLFPMDALSDADHLALLKVLSGQRHGAEEKFWTGRHLTTEDVVSQVRIWPQYRMSYTEQTIRICNQARSTTEEALFTFHLSPGSAVSSMSLWINGREEPARLTTAAKADTAYRTIVNVESRPAPRDPSVVYWQEGNRVTVRVFPCRAGEDRRVKLGITSPLRLEADYLIYQAPYFDGPDTRSADELVNVEFDQAPKGLRVPSLFDGTGETGLSHRGRYQPDWTLRFRAPALSTDAFVLNGQAYRVEPYQPARASFAPTDVYLDVNAAWTKTEFQTAFMAATQANATVWVFDDGLRQLTDRSLDATYTQLARQAFSLFPVYRIPNPATALLITKGTLTSPILSDLKNSPFARRFGRLATQPEPVRTYCLGQSLSPYLKTLAELRVLNVAFGTTDNLTQNVLQARRFPRPADEPGRVVLPEAGIAIRETPAEPNRASVAPDHLARLFTYNHLLQQIGTHYFAKDYKTDALIAEAQRAHVVSPLSSLVVLETEYDYDRFNISKDTSGLDNATLKEEGAVPEPHEWAMLAMVAGLIGWLLWQKRRGSVTVINR